MNYIIWWIWHLALALALALALKLALAHWHIGTPMAWTRIWQWSAIVAVNRCRNSNERSDEIWFETCRNLVCRSLRSQPNEEARSKIRKPKTRGTNSAPPSEGRDVVPVFVRCLYVSPQTSKLTALSSCSYFEVVATE